MSEKEFLEKRVPFWLETEDLRITIPSNSDKNDVHAHLSKKFGYNYMFVIRGYWFPNSHVQLYTGNYNIPNITVYVLSYIFEYFKDIKYIGLGCIIDTPGKIWDAQLYVPRNKNLIKNDILSQQSEESL
jgi:hypothetical protein